MQSNTATLLCVIFRFDGEEIKTDETIRTLAQKWQPTRRPRSEERNTKAVDTDMIVVSCVVSLRCQTALEMAFWHISSIASHEMKK